jgi:hypothetical protein
MDTFWKILGFAAITLLCVAGILAGLRADASELRRFARQTAIGLAVLILWWCLRRVLPDSGIGAAVLLPFSFASFVFVVLAWIYLFAGFSGTARARTRSAALTVVGCSSGVLAMVAVWLWG